jgi:hypothetical protein
MKYSLKYSLRTSSDIEFWVILDKDNIFEKFIPLEAFAYRKICYHHKDECIYIFKKEDLEKLESLDCFIIGKQGNIIVKQVDCKTFAEYVKLLNED